MAEHEPHKYRRLIRALELLVETIDARKKLDHIMKEFDDLVAEVAQDDSVIDGAVTLINGIAARIAAAGVDPVKLKAITDDLAAKRTALAAAVAANTPAAPTP